MCICLFFFRHFITLCCYLTPLSLQSGHFLTKISLINVFAAFIVRKIYLFIFVYQVVSKQDAIKLSNKYAPEGHCTCAWISVTTGEGVDLLFVNISRSVLRYCVDFVLLLWLSFCKISLRCFFG